MQHYNELILRVDDIQIPGYPKRVKFMMPKTSMKSKNLYLILP